MSTRKIRAGLCAGLAFGLFTLRLAGADPAPSSPAPGEIVHLATIVVTGSNIPTTENAFDARTVPVLLLDRKDIEQTGYFTTADLLQKITVSNGGSVPVSNNATGFTPAAASTSLRGLGPDNTLVLIDGKRVAVYPVGSGGTTSFVDLNSIPLAAIERVEVLKDGASAIYGADATAGVVNIILRKNYHGAEAEVGYGNTSDKDSGELTASLVMGTSTTRTNYTLAFNYQRRNSILKGDRAYSAVPPFLSSSSSPGNFQVSRAAVNAALGHPANASVPGVPDTDSDGNSVDSFFATTYGSRNSNTGSLPASAYTYSTDRQSLYNYNQFEGSYPQSERAGGLVSFDHRPAGTDRFHLYGDVMYQHVRMENQLAPTPTGDFSTAGASPIIIPASTTSPIGTRLAPAGAYNPFNPFNQDISDSSRLRLAEFGNRVFHDRTNAVTLDLGAKADNLFDHWTGDASVRFSRVDMTEEAALVSVSRFNRILNAADPIFNPASSQYIGTTVPYNPFGYYLNPIANNAKLVNYATVHSEDRNSSSLAAGYLTLGTDDLCEVPAGSVGFATGLELRKESVVQTPDAQAVAGDLLGSAPSALTDAHRVVGAVFAETEVPLTSPAQQIPLARSVSLNLAGRDEQFLSSHTHSVVPKLGLKWHPFSDDFVIRSSWGRGFREPSLFERFAGSTGVLVPIFDPVTRTSEPEQNAVITGNRRLHAEKTENLNAGFVFTPHALPGFTVAVDAWRIKRNGAVTVDYQDIVNRAFFHQPLLPGESVQRDNSGNLTQINGEFRNQGLITVQGIDLSTSYVLPVKALGRWEIGASATYLDSYKIQESPGARSFEYAGQSTSVLFDPVTGKPASPGTGDDGYVRWKGQAYLNWQLRGVEARVQANYTGGFADFTSDFDPSTPDAPGGLARVASSTTWDAQVSYAPKSRERTLLAETKLTLGVRNLFNREPPFTSAGGNNAAGYPDFLYSAEGRFVYVSITKRL